MSQRAVEILLGRLLTDDAFRGRFYSNHFACTSLLGVPLTLVEYDALRSLPKAVLDWTAENIDPRIRVVSPPYDRRQPGSC